MSPHADDPGTTQPYLPAIDLASLNAAGYVDAWESRYRASPDMAAEREAAMRADALAEWQAAAETFHIPAVLLRALHHGTPDCPYTVTVDGHRVRINISAASAPRCSSARAVQIWEALRRVVADTSARPLPAGRAFLPHPDLPEEIAVAVWEHNGTRIYVGQPATASRALRATRTNGHLKALCPIALLSALWGKAHGAAQITAGGVAVAGLAVTPAIPHQHAPAVVPYTAPVLDGYGLHPRTASPRDTPPQPAAERGRSSRPGQAAAAPPAHKRDRPHHHHAGSRPPDRNTPPGSPGPRPRPPAHRLPPAIEQHLPPHPGPARDAPAASTPTPKRSRTLMPVPSVPVVVVPQRRSRGLSTPTARHGAGSAPAGRDRTGAQRPSGTAPPDTRPPTPAPHRAARTG